MAATILFTGGNGFIGSNLASFLFNRGWEIIFYTKNPKLAPRTYRTITALTEIEKLPQLDAVINLAGAPMSQKWTLEYQQTLYDSRITTTLDLISHLRKFHRLPKTFISGSSVGYYLGQQLKCFEDTPVPEMENFSNRLCTAWEDSAKSLLSDDIRLCFARLGVVLGPKGGLLNRIENQFRLGLGMVYGQGTQVMSWVHLEDCINAFWHILQNSELSGPFNIVAPKTCTQGEFAKLLTMQFGKKSPKYLPDWLVRLIFGQRGDEMLLKGVCAVPNRLQQNGFFFKYSDIGSALQNFYS
jgi:uncharacterized protein